MVNFSCLRDTIRASEGGLSNFKDLWPLITNIGIGVKRLYSTFPCSMMLYGSGA